MVGSAAQVPRRSRHGATGVGLLDVRVLEQAHVWTEPDGTVRRVCDLPREDAEALGAHLRAECNLLYAVVLRREVAARLLALAATSAQSAEVVGARAAGPRVAGETQAGPDRSTASRGDAERAMPQGWPQLSGRARVRLWAALGRGPSAWLESTPLMRALNRQLDRSDGGEAP
ncbi:hypothetical protein ASH01_14365 [Terrabacter sp. Soil811]|nr:hypothetical protein ASH01_14365 [Terrabacter sp. Soil811]